MHQGEGQVGHLPHQILADQKAPPGSGGAPHYYLPPRIFDPCCMPERDSINCLFRPNYENISSYLLLFQKFKKNQKKTIPQTFWPIKKEPVHFIYTLIHQNLHLYKTSISVSRHPVRNHSGKSNYSFGLIPKHFLMSGTTSILVKPSRWC